MTEIEVIYGNPIGKANHYLATPHGIVKDSVIRSYERSFANQCHIYKGKKINVPFELQLTAYFATMASDLDNVLKTTLDCLQYCEAITNDNLCTKITASKTTSTRPRIEFKIIPSENLLFNVI